MQTTIDRVKGPALGVVARPVASVVDLFCGAGALSHGFVQEGFSLACGYDVDEACRYPFEENNDAPFVRRDVAAIDAEDLAREFATNLPQVMVGCAPCQPFSRYSQGREDPKWKLLIDFARLVVAVSPDVLSMENVPQLATFNGGDVFGEFVERLATAGYRVKWMIVDCRDYGVPQTRLRLVLIASRRGDPILPTPTHAPEHYVTVRDAIGDMRPLEAGEVDSLDCLHRTSSMSERNIRRIKASTPSGTWRDWDEAIVTDCHKRQTGKGYSSVYGRMAWDRSSPTITTQFYGFGNGRFGHPEQNRAISLREGAILQTFPHDYAFTRQDGPVLFKSIGRMIGNAVPVALARAIARALRTHLGESS